MRSTKKVDQMSSVIINEKGNVMYEVITFRDILKYAALFCAILCALGYVLFQARYMITGPQIILTERPASLQNQRQVELTGVAYNISRLWLNDRPIYTNAQGTFRETLIMENGYTSVTLKAQDRYGRETTVTEAFVYSPISFIQ